MGCPRNTLYIRLKGRGVQPVISLSVEDGLLDLGDALVGDTISSCFTVRGFENRKINELRGHFVKKLLRGWGCET